MRTVLSGCVCFLLLLGSLPGHAQQEAGSGPRELQALAEGFFAWRAVTQPASTDDVNRVERPDGWVPDFSPQALGAAQQKLEDFRRRLQALRPNSWPVAERVDYLLLRSALDRVDWELNVLRPARRNPNFYVDQTLGAVFEALVQPPPIGEARARNIILRLESIPNTLVHARLNLTEGVASFADVVLARLDHIGEGLARVQKGLGPLVPEGQRPRLAAAMNTAATALEKYALWLREKKPGMAGRVAVGREAYEHFLKRVALVPYSSDAILRLGALEWDRSVAFETYAKQRSRNLRPTGIFRD